MEWKRSLLAFIYTERCPYCSSLIDACEIACSQCGKVIRHKQKPICHGARGFRCVSSYAYGGRARQMIIKIKFRKRIQHIPQVAEILAKDIRNEYRDITFDLITAVPMHAEDLKKRGYNQSALLGKALAKLLDLPYQDTLFKIKKTKKQHLLRYKARKTNLNGAFKEIDKELIKDKSILIVDDIITSGYTLGNCCKVLSRSKPRQVCCAAIASAQDKYPDSTII